LSVLITSHRKIVDAAEPRCVRSVPVSLYVTSRS
jgi:hypothetical protein